MFLLSEFYYEIVPYSKKMGGKTMKTRTMGTGMMMITIMRTAHNDDDDENEDDNDDDDEDDNGDDDDENAAERSLHQQNC